MQLNQNHHVLVTSHHFLNLNSGAGFADYQMYLKYSKYCNATFITYSDLRIKDPRIARIVFPFFVVLKVLLQKIKNKRFTLVHANTSDASILLLTPLAKSIKVIVQSHGLELFQSEILPIHKVGIHNLIRKFWSDPLVKISLDRSSAFVSINQGESNWVKEKYPLTNVIESSVGVEPFSIPTELRIKSEIGTGIYFGRFDLSIKGLDFLTDQILILLRDGILKKFIFAGMPPEGEQYIEEKLRSSTNKFEVISKYEKKDLHRILNQADFFVVSSRVEGGPITLLEGMSAGLIPLSSRIPFAETVLGQRFPNLIFDVEVPGSFEESLKYIIENKIDRYEIVALANGYNWDAVLEKRFTAINELIT